MPTPICNHPEWINGCFSCRWWYEDSEKGRSFRMRFAPVNSTFPSKMVTVERVPTTTCLHLGTLTGEQVQCGSCLGTRIKLNKCYLHDSSCTVAKELPGIDCCAVCPDRQTQQPGFKIGRRHLLFHVYPVAGNGVWQSNVNELTQRWSMFTGRKIVSIMTHTPGTRHKLDTPNTVRRRLPPGCEVIELPNVTSLGEVVSWEPLCDKLLENAQDNDAMFYCHAKGVTREITLNTPCQEWTRLLWEFNLDYWHLVENQLSHGKHVCGAFLQDGMMVLSPAHPGMVCKWHYSGTFYWIMVGEFRERYMRTPIFPDPWGVEVWPGLAFERDKAGRIGPMQCGEIYKMYEPALWNSSILPAVAKWKTRNKPKPASNYVLDGNVSLSIIVPTSNKPGLARALESVSSQMLPGDELIVKRDATGDWGHTPRNLAMQEATGTHLMFMDDDDIYLPGALDRVRARLSVNPDKPHIFAMRNGLNGMVLPNPQGGLRCGNVSTQMIVVPNNKERLGTWGHRYVGDWDFISSTVAKYPPESLIWCPEVIAVWRAGDEK